MNETVNSASGWVLAARWPTAAVARSPPHVSSIVSEMPSVSQLAYLPRAGQSADLRDLQVDRVHPAPWKARRSEPVSAITSSSTIGSVVQAPDIEALLEGRARLLEMTRSAPSSSLAATTASCARQPPFASAITTSLAAERLEHRCTRAASSRGAVPSFSWNWWTPRRAGARPRRPSRSSRAERYRRVERGTTVEPPAAEQRADGQPRGPAGGVPAGDVDRALRIRVAEQRASIAVVDGRLPRVEAEHRRARARRARHGPGAVCRADMQARAGRSPRSRTCRRRR